MNQQLTTLRRHDEDAAPLAPASASSMEIATTRAAQEVQAAMVIAKKFPRDEKLSQARIEKACCRPSLAATSQYHYPRGGQEVSGISIRLAEVMAQAWGNIDSGVIELEQRDSESLMMAYCWDLETNTRSTKLFTVPHYREKKGRQGLEKIALAGTRDIYEMTAIMGSRRLRACILSIIPRDVQDQAVEICNQTLAADFTEEKRDRMIAAFQTDFGVTQEQLELFIGKRAAKFDGGTYVRLRRVYSTLKDGFATVQDFFPPKADPSSKPRGKFGFAAPGNGPDAATEQPPSQEVTQPAAVTNDATGPVEPQEEAAEVEPAEPQESGDHDYYCPACKQGFDFDPKTTVIRNGNRQTTCCPKCRTTAIEAWDDHVVMQTANTFHGGAPAYRLGGRIL